MRSSKSFATLLEAFFTDRLMKQRNASVHTIASYRDTFRLLLRYLQQHCGKSPSMITLQDLNATVIVDFLNHLEKERGNKVRSRNVRLAAIRSFFHYIAFEEPAQADLIQRVLAIPNKRWKKKLVSFLTPTETEALIKSIDRDTTLGCRDLALLLVATQTGLRASELTNLQCGNVVLGRSVYLHCHGKGRKDRCVPLTKATAKVVKLWLQLQHGDLNSPLFTNARGSKLSRDGVAYILKKYITIAQRTCPSLRSKHVSPHTLRHTNAVNLLQAGVEQATIALWLGHESIESTQVYLHADMEYKKKILAKLTPNKTKALMYRPDDSLLSFLNSL